MSLKIGELVKRDIEAPVASCACGKCFSCNASIKNTTLWHIDIANITLNGNSVEHSEFHHVFYQTLKNLIQARYPMFDSGSRNIAVVCEEKLDISGIIDAFFAELRTKGYLFTPNNLSERITTGMPVQFDPEQCVRFSEWVDNPTPTSPATSSNI